MFPGDCRASGSVSPNWNLSRPSRLKRNNYSLTVFIVLFDGFDGFDKPGLDVPLKLRGDPFVASGLVLPVLAFISMNTMRLGRATCPLDLSTDSPLVMMNL